MGKEHAFRRRRLRGLWSACTLLAAAVSVVIGLVGASVVGNRLNSALPVGFGLVGIAMTAALVAALLVVLISPRRLWQRTRAAAVAGRTSKRDAVRH